MESTLGKRIVTNRKRVGLTQDQLAEQLGVTAQAVSKWENDQSCPDINILPQLAEIFGISTDELLGREYRPAHQAEVMDEADEEDFEEHSDSNFFSFHYDSGRRGALGVASLILLTGGLLLAAALLDWSVTFWDILWPSAILVFGIFGAFHKFSFFCFGCTLFGGYFLLENLGVLPGTLGWDILLPICLLLFGFSLLADALRKPRKPKFSFEYNSDDNSKNRSQQRGYSADGNHFSYHASFGEESQYVGLPHLAYGQIHTGFGDYMVDLSGVDEVENDCSLEANCSFGELRIRVPQRYLVKTDSHSAFASVKVTGKPDSVPAGTILLSAHVSFGEIEIEYV